MTRTRGARAAAPAPSAVRPAADLARDEPGRGATRAALRRFALAPGNLAGALLLLIVVAMAVLAPLLAPHDPTRQALGARLKPPVWAGGSAAHVLGTDQLGRDLLSRIMFGARVSLLAGFASAVGAAALGASLGLVAGYFGGKADALIMRMVDVWMAFPFILLALATISVLGPGLRNMIIVFALTSWMVFARVTRATTLSLRELDFVVAARALGARSPRIIVRHILPNLTSPIIVLISFQIASLIMAEAALSFLGLGVRPQPRRGDR